MLSQAKTPKHTSSHNSSIKYSLSTDYMPGTISGAFHVVLSITLEGRSYLYR